MDLATGLLIPAGFVLLIGGAEPRVRGAARLATALGISPLIVGLTVVAFGHFPRAGGQRPVGLEWAARDRPGQCGPQQYLQCPADPGALRPGSSPGRLEAGRAAGVSIMIAVSALLFSMASSGLGRRCTFRRALIYIAYTVYVVLSGLQHGRVPFFTRDMLCFALPLNFLTLLVSTLAEFSFEENRPLKALQTSPLAVIVE